MNTKFNIYYDKGTGQRYIIRNDRPAGPVVYKFEQDAPILRWTVALDAPLSENFQVTIWDSNNSIILPRSIDIEDTNIIGIGFSAPTAGVAYIVIEE